MKKFFWALMLVATTLSFVACEEDKPVEEKPNPDQTEVCKDCGKNPCECEKEEVCPDCGKNPCECEPVVEPTSWADHVFVTEYMVDETAGYGYTQFDMSALVTEDGKHVYDLLGYESWAEMATAIGTLDQTLAEEGTVKVYGYDFGSESEYLEHNVGGAWGNWATATGMASAWGTTQDDKVIAVIYNKVYPDDAGLMTTMCEVGFMPGCIFEGDNYRVALMFVNEDGVSVGVEVKATVGAFVDPEAGKYPTTATPGTYDIDFETTISLSSLEEAYQPTQWREEFETVKTKLGMTMYEFANPSFENVLDDNGELYTGLSLTYTLPDGTTGSGVNVWLNADNQVVAWGASNGCVACIEWGYSATDMFASTCVFPGDEAFYSPDVQACVGKTFEVTYTITYIPDVDGDFVPDQDPTVVNMNFAVTIAE